MTDYLIHYEDGSLSHHGIQGMKWGHHKSKYDKKMLNNDTNYLMKKSVLNYGDSKRAAKNTQKRMSKHGESHSTAMKKSVRNQVARNIAGGTVNLALTALGYMYMTNPKVHGKVNSGAWVVGKAVRDTGYHASRGVSAVSKVLNRNMIKVNPVSVERGARLLTSMAKV